jgi:hypothetical protein
MRNNTMKRKHRVLKPAGHLIEAMEGRVLLSVSPTIDHPIAVTQYINQPTAAGLAGPAPSALTPTQIRGAYGIGNIAFGGTTGDGTGQTIAVVDAYDDPNAAGDLHAFDQEYGLPDPVFQKLNQQGQTSPLPGTDPNTTPTGDWEIEESLDIEWAHVDAPAANIILFEANDASTVNLDAAVNSARNNAAVSVVSMSFGGPESSDELTEDNFYTTPTGHIGVTFLAAAGDSGIYDPYDPNDPNSPPHDTVTPNYPASSPNVVAVGGTFLTVNGNSYASETGWGNGTNSDSLGGGGGGISQFEPQPAYQNGVVTQTSTQRAYPDVSMNADPNSGVAIYDSYDFSGAGSWIPGVVGGTSLATPTWAGLIAITDQGRIINGATTLDGATQTLPKLYGLPSSDFHDITLGNNGYAAGPGYDLVTGLGTPRADLLVPDLVGPPVKPLLGDFVFNDLNGNGIQDTGEPGIAGVTVVLMSPGNDGIIGTGDDTTVGTTTTDTNGLYHFAGITPGSYYIHFDLIANATFSPENQGSNPALQSDVNPATGDTALITVTPDTIDENLDCGMFKQSVSINNVSGKEGNSGLTPFVFTVTVVPIPVGTVVVSYATADGTATVADDDYVPTSGALVFIPGVSSETITVDVVGDTKIENSETFMVNLAEPPGFSGGNLVGTGTIINDDFPLAALGGGVSMTRPASGTVNYPFTVSLSAPAPFDVTVPYTTEDQTAIGGFDYTTTAGTLTFTPDQTSLVVNVPVIGGTNPELNKTFLFTIKGSPTAVLGTPAQTIATILSNSPPALSLANAQVTESLTGTAVLPFVVTLAPALSSALTVHYTTADGTAVAGLDYQATSGTLTMQPGQLQQTIFVPVFRRFLSAQDKTLTLNLSNLVASGTVLLSNAVATGTIHDLATATLPFNQQTKAVYTDYINNHVTVSLKGAGSGTVVFLGTQPTETDAYLILVNGTNASSALSIKTNGSSQTTFHDISVIGSMGSITGKTANLMDQLTVSGSLNTLLLNYLAGATISVGSGTGTLGLTFSRVLDTSITSAIPIRSLTAADYLNTDGIPDDVTAPDIASIKIKGNFQGTLVSENVAQVIVGGAISGASILATDGIGSVTAGSITGSTFFAGVQSNLSTLPSAASDFVNTNSRIGSVKVNHGSFSDTMIAAWKIGALSLGSVQTADGGTQFGVSDDQLASITALADTPIDLTKFTSATQSVVDSDFIIQSV